MWLASSRLSGNGPHLAWRGEPPGYSRVAALQHQTLLLSPVISITGYCFCFGSIPSFILELFIHWSPVAYWAPTDLGNSSFSILSFCLFILFMGFSRQEYLSGLPFPSPMDHILSGLSTMTCPSWVAPQAWLGFIELDKAVILVWLDWLVFCEYGFSVSALWCPLATPTILLGFLLLWAWGISSWLLQQSAAAAPYLGWGPSDLPFPLFFLLFHLAASFTSCVSQFKCPFFGDDFHDYLWKQPSLYNQLLFYTSHCLFPL